MRCFALAMVLGAGCRATQPCVRSDAAVDDDMSLRARVSWESSEPGRSWVEYADGLSTNAVDDGGTDHEASLVGLPPLTEIAWTAFTDTGKDVERCEGTVETGNVPADLPDLDVLVDDRDRQSPERWLGGVLLGDTGRSVAFVVDREGNWLFYQQAEDGHGMIDADWVEPGVLAVNSFDVSLQQDVGEIREIPLDGGDVRSLRTELAHHVFALVPGGYAWIALDIRDWTDPDTGETLPVGGDAIYETDRETGQSRRLWSTWDHFQVHSQPNWVDNSLYPGVADWTHGNGLNWVAATDTLVYSSPRLQVVAEIRRSDGAQVRTMGRDGDFRPPPDGELLEVHDPSMTADGDLLVSVHDASGTDVGAREYRLQGQAMVPVWEGGFDQGLQSMSLGQAIRLDNGNTLVNYGTAGAIQELTPEGDVVWDVRTELGASFGNVRLTDRLYPE